MKSFEERLARLEEISGKIRDGGLPLEDAVKHFEEGMRLARELERELSKIERKIEILVSEPATPAEPPRLELFPDLGDDAES